MGLVTTEEMFKKAYEGGYAIGAFNVNNMEIVQGIMEAANETNSPVILQVSAGARKYANPIYLKKLVEAAIECNKQSGKDIPVVLHLDHGPDFETCKDCIDSGFTSVMIDGSKYSFEENVRITKEIVEIAKPLNVSVEAELGTIGNLGDSYEGGASEIIYTDPVKARELVERTGIDTLAVAIGTSHGLYPKWMTPKLNLELLKEIKSQVGIPLVLHGGSANPDNEIAESVKLGICKINISSDIKSVFFKKVRETLKENEKLMEPHEIFSTAINEAKKVVKHKLELFNCIDKARLY